MNCDWSRTSLAHLIHTNQQRLRNRNHQRLRSLAVDDTSLHRSAILTPPLEGQRHQGLVFWPTDSHDWDHWIVGPLLAGLRRPLARQKLSISGHCRPDQLATTQLIASFEFSLHALTHLFLCFSQ